MKNIRSIDIVGVMKTVSSVAPLDDGVRFRVKYGNNKQIIISVCDGAAEELADLRARDAEWKAIVEHLISVLGNANAPENFIPHCIKLLLNIKENDLADALALTGFASTLESQLAERDGRVLCDGGEGEG